MLFLYAGLLGTIQGLTEFLPISSSAHLILARAFFGWEAEQFGLAFDVACHVGTLGAVVLYYRADLIALAASLPRLFSWRAGAPVLRRARVARGGPAPRSASRAPRAEDWNVRLLWLLAIGTVPAAVAGLLFDDLIEHTLRQPIVTVATLTAGAVLLLVAERAGGQTRTERSITMGEGFGLGVAQAAALVPGVSRSGATIATGMLLGLRRESAARFTFLLGVPAILAAAVKEGLAVTRQPLGPDAAPLFIVGLITSAVVGYFTVKYFIRYLARHALDVFAYYRFGLAAVTAVWLLR